MYVILRSIALHHAKAVVTSSSRSGVGVVDVPRCRKQGICDTGVINNVIYDTGLNILPVQQDTTYLVEYWAVFGTG